ncbi:ATP-binding protein [Candidatus Pyrohabitans sp.]
MLDMTTKINLQELLDALPFYVMLVDEEHNILLVNRAISRELGVEPEKVIGGYCPKVVHGLEEPYPGCPLEEAVEKGHCTVEKELFNEEFGRWVKSAVYPTRFKTKEGRRIYFHMVYDITERKLAEEQVQKYAKELERSNQLKDLFIDIMAHDLLNIVSIMSSMEELLLKRQSALEESREFMVITGSTERLISMIKNASKLAKLESVEKLELEEQDLCEIVKVVISTFKPMLDEKELKVELTCDGSSIANVNPCIEDVFSNLLSNAIKYSPEKSKITVEILDEGESLKICVRDRGEGVPDEYKDEIFSRFRRLEKRGAAGRGLGLAIVKRIVELHSGEVWVEDNPGGGSIFNVRIPKNKKNKAPS